MYDNINRITLTRKFLEVIRYLSPQTTSVWIDLNSYWLYKKGTTERIHEWVRPNIATICNGTGLSKNTVRKCLKELKILGFIKKIENQYDPETQLNKANIYYLDDNPSGIIDNLKKLKEFRNTKRAKDTISDDGWG